MQGLGLGHLIDIFGSVCAYTPNPTPEPPKGPPYLACSGVYVMVSEQIHNGGVCIYFGQKAVEWFGFG